MSIVNRAQLVADLKHSVAELRLNRGNGIVGILTATLLPHYIPGGVNIDEEINKDHNPEVLAVWDTVGKQWRSIRLEWIVSAQHMGSV